MARISPGSSVAEDFSFELADLEDCIATKGHPRCFNSADEYQAWRQQAGADYPRFGFCRDCMPDYQKAMAAAGRCHFQWARFEQNEEDGVIGIVPHLRSAELS